MTRSQNPSLCVLPFLQFNILPNGYATPCCTSGTILRNDQGEELNILTHSFEEIWRSKSLAEMRQLMLEGQTVQACAGCFSKDAKTYASYRDEMNYKLLQPDENGEYPVDFAERFLDLCRSFKWFRPKFSIAVDDLNAVTLGKPKSFDLRVDNKCNLKCVICGPAWSSQIELDPVHSAWANDKMERPTQTRFESNKNWARSPQLAEEVFEFGRSAEYVQLAGGEPFASRVCMDWMKEMVRTRQCERVDLKIFTNAQLLTRDIVDMLAQFRTVVLVLSIDAYGKQYEYVRYPGKWSNLEKNIPLVAELKALLADRCEAYINFTLSAFTLLSIRPLLDWALEHDLKVMLSYAGWPKYVSAINIPPDTKPVIVDYLTETSQLYADRMPYLPWFIGRLVLDIERTPFDTVSANDFIRFAADLDRTRSLDFQSVFPEISKEFKEWSDLTGNNSDSSLLGNVLSR